VKLFIANCTKQHQQFWYRVPETGQLKSEDIPVGTQVLLGKKDFTEAQIAGIVDKHRVYGLVAASQVKNMRGFVGLCYSIGDPVRMEAIVEGAELNDKAADERATTHREAVVASIAETNSRRAQEAGLALQRTEVETVEDTQGTPNLAVGIEIPAEGVKPRREGKRRAERRGA